MFRRLDKLVSSAKDCGIQVQFWKIPREENSAADELAGEVMKRNLLEEEQTTTRWRTWLEDTWYGEFVSYLLFQLVEDVSEPRWRSIKRESKKYVLLDEGTESPAMAY